MAIELEPSWLEVLGDEFEKSYMVNLKAFLKKEKDSGIIIYPKEDDIFNAFKLTPFDKVKVVIIGQDPYHGPGQAHGLSFSVPKDIKLPPSLKNIYKELTTDITGFKKPDSGDLTQWAEQGVLLLNASLTVKESKAGSHLKEGWETFTNAVISEISKEREGIIFLLWGKFAQSKAEFIVKERKHTILCAAHPSFFSANKGFFGCQHFSKTNAILKEPIDWQIH